MFALQGGQHATYFYPDPANTANGNDPLGSAGSWETPFSSPDELSLGMTNFVPKGAGGNRGSPLSHLPSFDQTSSGGVPAALASMGSLPLADQSAFFQVSILSHFSQCPVSLCKPKLDLGSIICLNANQSPKSGNFSLLGHIC
jgi:hypothetical protein